MYVPQDQFLRCLVVVHFSVVVVDLFLFLLWIPYPYMASRTLFSGIGLRLCWSHWIWGRSCVVVSLGLLWLIVRSFCCQSSVSLLPRTMDLSGKFGRVVLLLIVPIVLWWRNLCVGRFVYWFVVWSFLCMAALHTSTESCKRLGSCLQEVLLCSSTAILKP